MSDDSLIEHWADDWADDPLDQYFYNGHIVNEFLAWGLLSFLSEKGLLDKAEFIEYLKEYLRLDAKVMRRKKR